MLRRIGALGKFNSLLPDFVEAVELAEEGRVNPVVAEVAMEQYTTLLYGFTDPIVERICL